MQTRINDTSFRLVLIPAFGIVIPLITGMIRPDFTHLYLLVAAFLYTIMIAYVVWQGNRYFLFTLRDYFDWFNKPVQRIIALLLAICLYTIPVSVVLHIGWYRLFTSGGVNWNTVYVSTLIILICVIFISHTYETVFLVKETETEKIKSEQLQRAKTEAELQALNSQIDPHFLFNSLNTLSHLIEESPDKAVEFNDSLADVYRYILDKRSADLVTVAEELAFANKYFTLIHQRFGDAVKLRISNNYVHERYLPPISIQCLLENAIKHNRFDAASPLQIFLDCTDDHIKVSNIIQQRKQTRTSAGTGLKNLQERYRLIMNKQLTVERENNLFTVTLPLLKLNA